MHGVLLLGSGVRLSVRALRAVDLLRGVDVLVGLVDLEDLEFVERSQVILQSTGGAIGVAVPLACLVVAAEIFEDGGVGAEELGAPGKGSLGVELGDLEFEERLLRLAEVETGAGHRDGEVDALLGVELRGVGFETGLERLLGAAEAALAVDHQCEVAVESAQAAVGAQLAQRQGEVAGAVGGDREGLTGDGDAPRAPARREGVLVREGRVIVDEQGTIARWRATRSCT